MLVIFSLGGFDHVRGVESRAMLVGVLRYCGSYLCVTSTMWTLQDTSLCKGGIHPVSLFFACARACVRACMRAASLCVCVCFFNFS